MRAGGAAVRTDPRLEIRRRWEFGVEEVWADPDVPDDVRAAAGAQTLGAALDSSIEANRVRAGAAWQTPMPGHLKCQRVWAPRSVSRLRARLGDCSSALWAEGDVLHVLWRGPARAVRIGPGVRTQLWPVAGTDLWEASLRIRSLHAARLSFVVRAGHDPLWRSGPGEAIGSWDGPAGGVRPPQPAPEVPGLEHHLLPGAALGGPREITVWQPTRHEPVAWLLLADGQGLPGYAALVGEAVQAGLLAPIGLVGIHHAASSEPRSWPDLRGREYLDELGDVAFAAHERWVLEEVLPSVAPRTADRPLLVGGASNGGAWALGFARRHPELVAGVVALSPGGGARFDAGVRAPRLGAFLGGGLTEPAYLHNARTWERTLREAGQSVRLTTWLGGHDAMCWGPALVEGLQHLTGSRP